MGIWLEKGGSLFFALIDEKPVGCEINAARLWLQTTDQAKDAHRLYYRLGFTDSNPPDSMDVLERTTKIMKLSII